MGAPDLLTGSLCQTCAHTVILEQPQDFVCVFLSIPGNQEMLFRNCLNPARGFYGTYNRNCHCHTFEDFVLGSTGNLEWRNGNFRARQMRPDIRNGSGYADTADPSQLLHFSARIGANDP